MEPTPGPPRRDDDRKNAWLPFAIIAALIVLLFLALIIVFRRDDDAERAEGSLPESFDSLTTAPATTSTTSTLPPTAPPTIVVPTTRGGNGSSQTDAPPVDETTTPAVGSPAEELEQMAKRVAATVTSDVVPIGSDLYAMIVVNGRGQLLRWTTQREWEVADRLDPPGAIREIGTVDVTGDGIQDFLITLSGLGQPGGVYSRATFEFGLLPFNTVDGKENFVDGLTYRLGKLQSPFRDVSGSRTLTWTWTGKMFETR
jgi:hypothetical protein